MSTAKVEIQRVLEEVIAPLVQADGGRLFVLRIDDDSVDLHLAGRFSGCPGNDLVARRIIEPAIAAVAPGVACRVSSGARVPEGSTLVEPRTS
jgi:Fe-S cluster biogenesis protein NfuA